jgi:hypothetical protein
MYRKPSKYHTNNPKVMTEARLPDSMPIGVRVLQLCVRQIPSDLPLSSEKPARPPLSTEPSWDIVSITGHIDNRKRFLVENLPKVRVEIPAGVLS